MPDEVTPWEAFDNYVESLNPSPEFLAAAAGAVADSAAGAEDADDKYVPAMPVVKVKKDKRKRHRQRVATSGRRFLFNAVVARLVGSQRN